MPTRSMIPNLVQTSNIGQNWQLGQNLSPENALKLQDIERRQQIANLFTQQAMTPKGAVKAGNRFMVAPSGWEHAATLMNAAAGAGGMYMAGQQRQDLADELVKTRATDLETLDASQRDTPGREADTLPQGQPATPSNLEYQFGNAPIDADTLTREKITQLLKMQGPTLKKPVTSNEGVAEALTAQRGVPPFVTQPSYYTLPEPGPKPPLAAPSEQEGVAAALTTQRSPTSLADPRAGAQPHPYYTMGQDEIPATQGPLRPAIEPVERTEQERTSGYMKGMTSSDPLVRRMAEFYAEKHESEKTREDNQQDRINRDTALATSKRDLMTQQFKSRGEEIAQKFKDGEITLAEQYRLKGKMQDDQQEFLEKDHAAKYKALAASAALSNTKMPDEDVLELAEGILDLKGPAPIANTKNNGRVMATVYRLANERGINYNAMDFPVARKTMLEFTSGPSGKIVQSFNTLEQHMQELRETSANLGNSDSRIANFARQKFLLLSGGTPPTDQKFVAQVVSAELVKAITASPVGGSVRDRQEMEDVFKDINGPQQLASAMTRAQHLIDAQLDSMAIRYKAGTGRDNFWEKIVQHPKRTLESMTGYSGK